MAEAAEKPRVQDPVALAALARVFLKVSLGGFGGGLALAHRIAVDERCWLTEQEFADIVGLCQFLPGPNIVGIAVCTGTRLRGVAGAFAAAAGFLLIPLLFGFSAAVLLLSQATNPMLQKILGGVSVTAAGLLVATGIRLLSPHRERPSRLLFAALAFALVVLGKLPLLAVLFALVPISVAAAGFQAARTR